MKIVKQFRSLYSKIFYRGVQDAELRWWAKKGVKSGRKHYDLYNEIYNLDKFDFSDKVCIDVGGGMYPVHLEFDCGKKILVDPLVNEYKKIEGFEQETFVEYFENFDQLNSRYDMVDVTFCFNALDHAKKPSLLIQEIYDSLKHNVLFFLYSHIGNPIGGSTHPNNLTRSDYENFLNGKFETLELYEWDDKRWKDKARFPAFIFLGKRI